MLKKCLAVFLTLLLFALPASAKPQISEKLLQSAGAAVSYLIAGEYERLVTLLPFSGIAPGATEWERFRWNYPENAAPAQEGVVAFWQGGKWNIAAAVSTNEDGRKDALVLLSKDGQSFIGYRYATWDQIEAACAESEDVIAGGG